MTRRAQDENTKLRSGRVFRVLSECWNILLQMALSKDHYRNYKRVSTLCVLLYSLATS